MDASFQCAGCGEWNETSVDESAGQQQNYVEDCQICCRPNVLRVTYDPDAEAFSIHCELEYAEPAENLRMHLAGDVLAAL